MSVAQHETLVLGFSLVWICADLNVDRMQARELVEARSRLAAQVGGCCHVIPQSELAVCNAFHTRVLCVFALSVV